MWRLSVDAECKGAYTCPAVWRDDDPGFLVIVGHPVNIAVAPGMAAVRLKRQIVADSGARIIDTACHVDPAPDHLVVVGEHVPAETVVLANGDSGVADDELAVRVQCQTPDLATVGW